MLLKYCQKRMLINLLRNVSQTFDMRGKALADISLCVALKHPLIDLTTVKHQETKFILRIKLFPQSLHQHRLLLC